MEPICSRSGLFETVLSYSNYLITLYTVHIIKLANFVTSDTSMASAACDWSQLIVARYYGSGIFPSNENNYCSNL